MAMTGRFLIFFAGSLGIHVIAAVIVGVLWPEGLKKKSEDRRQHVQIIPLPTAGGAGHNQEQKQPPHSSTPQQEILQQEFSTIPAIDVNSKNGASVPSEEDDGLFGSMSGFSTDGQGIGQGSASGAGKGMGSETGESNGIEDCWSKIGLELKARSQTQVPPAIVRRGISGKVVLVFTLDPNGIPTEVLLESVEGSPLVVEAAHAILKNSFGRHCPGQRRWSIIFTPRQAS